MSDAGLNETRLEHLRATIEADVKRRLYHGAVIIVARHGRIGFQAAIGSADLAQTRPLRSQSVFSIFSVTKAMTNILVLRAVELGQLALTTKVVDIIPEFSGGLREQITLLHLITHSSGLPMVFTPKPGMYIDRLDEIIAAICQNVHSVEPPGERCAYSPLANQALLGEALRRTDPKGRSYRAIVDEELFKPLGMTSSAIGLRADLKSRHIVPDFRGNFPIEHPGHSNLGPNGAFEEEHAEMPWVGAVSTVPDMFRLAEMLRRDGTLDGVRILSPATLAMARRNWTGDKPNELYKVLAHKRGWEPSPAYIGLGFSLRGTAHAHHMFGTLTSAGTFGNYGAGSALYWVDPERAVTFVCLTAGVMESNDNIERFQRLSDIAISAAE
ncbi:MAG TPA: serine hydrolase domain-containing protein [Steroidobacteraceae bacterium]|nr:serine hydrolase domain-containing protein [Steroidobacteraceae bacterium]